MNARMTTTAISVVIPTYNRPALTRRAIESALHQTHSPAEVIVVDDGSTDDTGSQLQAYGSAIRYVYQSNAGASIARNRGVDEARSPWIAFLDSDDVWVEDHLERMAAAIEATHGEARFYFSDMRLPLSEGGGTLWEEIGFVVNGPHQMIHDATSWVLLERQPTMLQASVLQKGAYQAAGGLQKQYRLVHDTHIFVKLGLGQPACAVAGCGTVQTADDDAGTRLTAIHSSKTRGYWEENLRLWTELSGDVSHLDREHRKVVASYVAQARWRLARHAWLDRQFARCVGEALHAVQSSPGAIGRIVYEKLRRNGH